MNDPFSPFSEQGRQPPFSPPARSAKKIFALLAAAAVAGLVVIAVACGGLLYLGATGISSREPTEEEKAAVVTVADLEPHGAEVAAVEQREVWKTKRNLDGTLEVEYEYDPDRAAGPGDTITVESSVAIEHTEKDARQMFSINIAAYQAGMRIYGVKTREQKHFMVNVDQSYFAVLVKDDIEVGNMVVVRKGKRIHGLLVVGLTFDDATVLEAIVREKIERGEGLTTAK